MSAVEQPALAEHGRALGKGLVLVAGSMFCAYMSATLLVGLLVTRFLGWWWADSLAALSLTFWEGKECFERAADRPGRGCHEASV